MSIIIVSGCMQPITLSVIKSDKHKSKDAIYSTHNAKSLVNCIKDLH